MKSLVFVTTNTHKIADAQKLLPEYKIDHVDYEIQEIQSLHPNEVAEHKLRTAYAMVQKPCFVMDTSFCINSLNGFPGPFCKWWFEMVGEEKVAHIVSLLEDTRCQVSSILGYFDGLKYHFLEETLQGSIAEKPRGTRGYHWDTIFVPKGSDKTFAEMTFEEKQSYAVTHTLLRKFHSLLNA